MPMQITENQMSSYQAPTEYKFTRPMIQIVQGPSAGRIYPIERRITLIGRWSCCDVILDPSERTFSKRHAIIERRSDGYYLVDVGSLAGTFVAGRPIKAPCRLTDGTCFRICNLVFAFTDGVAVSEDWADESTVAVTIDVSNPSPDRLTVPPEKTLQAILNIARNLGQSLQRDEVLERALDSLLDLFPHARRGTAFLLLESDGTPMARVIRCRSGQPVSPPICQAILSRVIGGREAILSKDSPADFPDSHSVVDHAIRSLISAPLLDSAGHALGAIQLDVNEGDGQSCDAIVPFEAEDLDVLVSMAGPIGIAVENAKRHQDVIRLAEYGTELELARRVLMDLLPKYPCEPAGYESFSYYEPARQVGGDYLGAFPLASLDDSIGGPARRWALAVGDVSGHGLPAALFLARLSAEVRLVLRGEVDPARCLALLNEQIMATAHDDYFVTFSLATIDARTHRFEAASAGHLAPLVRRAAGGPLERIGQDETGLPLGVRERCRYQSGSTTIEPGDVVVLVTDGIFEAMGPVRKCLGLPRLERVILDAPPGASAVGHAILEAIREHSGGEPQADDMTICCLGRLALAH